MKKVMYLMIVLISIINCKAQEGYHSLTAAEYANIEFQGVSFEAIKATDGNVQQMEQLFTGARNNGEDLLQ